MSKTVTLTIDGQTLTVPAGYSIWEAAHQVGINIPNLCHHPALRPEGSCRVCVVKVKGARNLSASCVTKVAEGMEVSTHTPEVLAVRKNIVELLLANHPRDCLSCARSGNCELQKIASDMGIRKIPYNYNRPPMKKDEGNPSITRDPAKCILCGRCVRMCSEVQGIGVYGFTWRGINSRVSPAFDLPLDKATCTYCGQCAKVCPTGAITIHNDTDKVWAALRDPEKIVMVQTAPSVRVGLSEALGGKPGDIVTGKMGAEYTIASPSQLLDPFRRDWDFDLIDRFGLPRRLFLPIQMPGAVRGTLLPEIARECGVSEIPVIAVTSHDTASAVAAIPVSDPDFAYISSGTWSLLGAELSTPLCEPGVMNANYTNEGGVGGSIRLLKNIMGLWIVQEVRRAFKERGQTYSFAELADMAAASPSLVSFIDPDAEDFFAPGNMPEKVQAYCQRTGQAVPQTPGEINCCVLQSLAMRYRWCMERLEKLSGQPLDTLHIVGGGCQNAMLNQMTANSIGRRVVAGPVEGTAIGNLLVQAMASGEVKDIQELREVVAASFPNDYFEPENKEAWDAAYEEYKKVTA